MENPSSICEYLRENHRGRKNAVHSRELQRLFSVRGSTLRRNISRLRQIGYPICSDSRGYYYAESQKDINDTIFRLNSLVTGISNSRTGMLYASIKPVQINISFNLVSQQEAQKNAEQVSDDFGTRRIDG